MNAVAADYLDILVLCSSPIDLTPNLNLHQELALFEDAVRAARIPIRLRRVFPPTEKQLEKTLRHFRPQVFHYLGHGEEDGLWFEDEYSSKTLIRANQLRRILAQADSPLQLVLLNACRSGSARVLSLCRQLVNDSPVQVAIGHTEPVADESAIRFSQRFYELLIDGDAVNKALRKAANQMAEQGLPGFNQVVLEGDSALRLAPGRRTGERPAQVDDGIPPNCWLPATDYFCGRSEEYAELVAGLDDNQLTGLAIWGIGGMGKTALAKEIAYRNAWRYGAGGAAFIDIRDLPDVDRTVAGLLRRAQAYLVKDMQTPDPAMGLVRHLRTAGPGLIVLDNLEDLPNSEHAALANFVRNLPRNGSRVLLTARTRIAPFEDLPVTRSRDLVRGLDDWSGAQYVHWVAEKKAIRPLQETPRINAGRVEGQCARVNRALSGHPKMIEIAVGIARKGMDKLDRSLQQLGGPLEIQLQSLLQTGLALVGEEGRRLWSYLPLFPAGRMMPEALEHVMQAIAAASTDESESAEPKPLPAWVEQGLDQLEQAAFLDFDTATQTYGFHQSVLEQAWREGGLTAEEMGVGARALLFFYVGYLRDNSQRYEAIDRCLDNALPLLEHAWQSRSEEATGLDQVLATAADALGYYFEQRGLWLFGQRWQERAVELHKATGNTESLGHALYKQALFHYGRGEPQQAREALADSITFSEKTNNQQGLSASLHQLASIESAQGNPAEARKLLQRSMAIDEELGDRRGLSASLHQLASIESAQGNPAEARKLLQRSTAIDEELGDRRGLSASLHLLASIESAQGNPAEARKLLQRSMAILEELGDRRGLSASLHQLAILEVQAGELDKARDLWQRSIAIKKTLGDIAGQAASYAMLAQLEASQGDFAAALPLAREAVDLLERIGSGQAGQARQILRSIEAMANGKDNPPQSTGLAAMLKTLQALPLEQALAQLDALLAQTQAADEKAQLWLIRSALCWNHDDREGCFQSIAEAEHCLAALPPEQREPLEQAIQAAKAQITQAGANTKPESVRLFEHAMAALQAERYKDALALFEDSLDASRTEQIPHNIATNQLMIGQVLLLSNQPAEAMVHLQEGLTIATELNDEQLLQKMREVVAVAVQQSKT